MTTRQIALALYRLLIAARAGVVWYEGRKFALTWDEGL